MTPSLLHSFRGHLPSVRQIQTAVQALSHNKLVCLPVDTGYSFVGNPKAKETLKSFLALRRAHPKEKPFTLLCSSLAQAAQWAQVDTPTYRSLQKRWPGPYTVVLPSNRQTPECALYGKSKTVGIRVPQNDAILTLIREFDHPLLTTSVTDADELQQENYFEGEADLAWWTQGELILHHLREEHPEHGQKVGCILSALDPCPLRLSTVLDFTSGSEVVLREGSGDF